MGKKDKINDYGKNTVCKATVNLSVLALAVGTGVAIIMNEEIRAEIQAQAKDFLKISKKIIRYCKKALGIVAKNESSSSVSYEGNWSDAMEAVENWEQEESASKAS